MLKKIMRRWILDVRAQIAGMTFLRSEKCANAIFCASERSLFVETNRGTFGIFYNFLGRIFYGFDGLPSYHCVITIII